MIENTVYKKLQHIVEDKVGKYVSSAETLKDVGLDSITFVELVVEIEKDFDISFPIDKLSMGSFESIKELAELVSELSNTN